MNVETLSLGNFGCRAILNHGDGIPIVFLHGYSFTSEIWKQINILDALGTRTPYAALDMPYGIKSECHPKTRDPEANISLVADAVLKIFGHTEPMLVGASLGGYIAMQYAIRRPVSGLLLVAPVGSEDEDLTGHLHKLTMPVCIVYGSQDSIVTLREMKQLSHVLPNSRLVVYENAAHPAYLSRPDDFKRDLRELYEKVSTRI
jgi:pimeloyl-ACP methyl ester carboxylesterase